MIARGCSFTSYRLNTCVTGDKQFTKHKCIFDNA